MTKNHLKTIALSDWDLTLYSGFMLKSWTEYLVSEGLFDNSISQSINILFNDYNNHNIGYINLCNILALMYANGLKGREKKDIYKAADDFIVTDIIRVYEFSIKMVSLLKKLEIPVFVLSGAPIEPLIAYSKKIGFQIISGLEVTADSDNIYTGKIMINPGLPEVKAEIINDISKKNKVIIAFGDSISDIPLLNIAQKGIWISSSLTSKLHLSNTNIKTYTPEELNENIETIIYNLDIGV